MIETKIMDTKKAVADYPILPILAERWSPYGFEKRPVWDADLRSLFESARWAASSYNEQPWNYLVAARENSAEFERLLTCLVEANQRQRHIHCHDNGKAMGPGKVRSNTSINISSTL